MWLAPAFMLDVFCACTNGPECVRVRVLSWQTPDCVSPSIVQFEYDHLVSLEFLFLTRAHAPPGPASPSRLPALSFARRVKTTSWPPRPCFLSPGAA